MYKIFEFIIEILGWIRIVLSPTLVGIFVGLVINYNFPSWFSLVVSILISILGLVIGIIWATKIWKKTGTNHFLSRITATPELDRIEHKKED